MNVKKFLGRFFVNNVATCINVGTFSIRFSDVLSHVRGVSPTWCVQRDTQDDSWGIRVDPPRIPVLI